MFYLVGLGLGDAKDITVKGLEIVHKCDKVYLESYTSILTVGKDVLVNITLKIRQWIVYNGIFNILYNFRKSFTEDH